MNACAGPHRAERHRAGRRVAAARGDHGLARQAQRLGDLGAQPPAVGRAFEQRAASATARSRWRRAPAPTRRARPRRAARFRRHRSCRSASPVSRGAANPSAPARSRCARRISGSCRLSHSILAAGKPAIALTPTTRARRAIPLGELGRLGVGAPVVVQDRRAQRPVGPPEQHRAVHLAREADRPQPVERRAGRAKLGERGGHGVAPDVGILFRPLRFRPLRRIGARRAGHQRPALAR